MLTKKGVYPKYQIPEERTLKALGYIQTDGDHTFAEYHHKSRKQDGFRIFVDGTIILTKGFTMVKIIHEVILPIIIQKGWWCKR